jgi:signal transduction histidine kinase
VPVPDKPDSSEREQTDTSLQNERDHTDRALTDRPTTADEDADQVIARARAAADALVSVARDRADERLTSVDPPTEVHATIEDERAYEDRLIRDERAAADRIIDDERRTLATLLALEREKTDRYLLIERVRSDDALANRDDFLGIVSHDLRNLLGGIVMHAALLSRMTPADERGKYVVEGMARIQRYAATMNRLVGDLVDVASIDAGKLAVTTAPGDVAALIVEAVAMFQDAAAAKGVALATEMGAGPLPAEFDHVRALQILANLITNAIKFTEPGGSIRLTGEVDGEALRVSVRDSGVGIPGDMLEAVFDRFWQVGKNDRRGLGLGLYISRCLVEAQGGRIWAESTPGVGSTLCFTLRGAGSPPPAGEHA